MPTLPESVIDPALEELRRVLTSPAFARSPRLSSLLTYIVEHSLDGRTNELTEQQIGMQVFGRAPGYNSSEDTIVRVTVRQLRQRLELFYSAEGPASRLRIDIPKGQYVAHVERITEKHLVEAPQVTPASLPLRQPGLSLTERSVRRYQFVVALLVAAVLVLLGALILQHRRLPPPSTVSGPAALWRTLFTADRKTLIVPGDGGLDNFIAWEQKEVPLEQYVNRDYLRSAKVTASPTGKDVAIGVRSVTPMADLAFTAMLMRAADEVAAHNPASGRVEIRYARDVAVADTHDNNLILLGAESFNPWTSLYHPQMDFVQHFDPVLDLYTIRNKAPRPGEQTAYTYSRERPTLKEYTHLALLTNSQGVGRVLIVEGTSMGSTYGALNLLTHEALFSPVLQQATDRSGRLHDFEVVLSGNFLHGGVSNSQVIALHVHE